MRRGCADDRLGQGPRYPNPVDTPDSLADSQSGASGEDPLILALREEDERLRSGNQLLTEQMAAIRGAQEELAKHLRVTAQLRRVQKSLRHRAGERRPRAAAANGIQPSEAAPRPTAAHVITDDQATRHPLLSRTRDWLEGGSLLPEPDIRPLRLREARLAIEDFEHEAASIDGTTAHVLERFVGALIADAGMSVIRADEVAGRLASARARGDSGDADAG
jgi:hypothetical protein